jgi:hypothetical protein
MRILWEINKKDLREFKKENNKKQEREMLKRSKSIKRR